MTIASKSAATRQPISIICSIKSLFSNLDSTKRLSSFQSTTPEAMPPTVTKATISKPTPGSTSRANQRAIVKAMTHIPAQKHRPGKV